MRADLHPVRDLQGLEVGSLLRRVREAAPAAL